MKRLKAPQEGSLGLYPHFSPPFYYARGSARRKGAYSLQPARRRVSCAFAVFRSVPPRHSGISTPSRRTAVRYAGVERGLWPKSAIGWPWVLWKTQAVQLL